MSIKRLLCCFNKPKMILLRTEPPGSGHQNGVLGDAQLGANALFRRAGIGPKVNGVVNDPHLVRPDPAGQNLLPLPFGNGHHGVSQTQAARQLWQQAQSRHTTLAQLARRSQSRTRSGLAAPMQALADARQASAAWQQHLAAQTSTLLAQTALMRALAVPAPL